MNLPQNVVEVASEWTTNEHRRLHGPGNSALSNLNEIRRVSGLDVDHSENMPVLKARQHIARLMFKTSNLAAAGQNIDFAGRYLSDSLKIFAGWQVKKAVAQATNQQDFYDKIVYADQDVSTPMEAAVLQLLENPLALIHLEADQQNESLNDSLASIADRASTNEDWGLVESPMVAACDVGQIACCRMILASLNYQHDNFGSFEAIPLREPAADADDALTAYPFIG